MEKLGFVLFFVLIAHVVCHHVETGNRIDDVEDHIAVETDDNDIDTMNEVLNDPISDSNDDDIEKKEEIIKGIFKFNNSMNEDKGFEEEDNSEDHTEHDLYDISEPEKKPKEMKEKHTIRINHKSIKGRINDLDYAEEHENGKISKQQTDTDMEPKLTEEHQENEISHNTIHKKNKHESKKHFNPKKFNNKMPELYPNIIHKNNAIASKESESSHDLGSSKYSEKVVDNHFGWLKKPKYSVPDSLDISTDFTYKASVNKKADHINKDLSAENLDNELSHYKLVSPFEEDSRSNSKTGDEQCQEAKHNIFMCTTERMRSRCIWVNGEWKSVNIGECKPTEYCNKTLEACVEKNEFVARINVACGTAGDFPDPQFCQIYHKCSENLDKTQETCPAGSVFNAAIHKCSPNIGDCVISWTSFDVGVVTKYPRTNDMYYMCSESGMDRRNQTVIMFNCPEYYEYVGNKCIAYQPPGSTSTTTAETTTTTTAEGETTTTTQSTDTTTPEIEITTTTESSIRTKNESGKPENRDLKKKRKFTVKQMYR